MEPNSGTRAAAQLGCRRLAAPHVPALLTFSMTASTCMNISSYSSRKGSSDFPVLSFLASLSYFSYLQQQQDGRTLVTRKQAHNFCKYILSACNAGVEKVGNPSNRKQGL